MVELGIRAGYVFERGWSIGPIVSFLRGGVPEGWFTRHEAAALGARAKVVE